MYHPPRGGVRGGKDQFNWDDVKGDKHRENYLGHSLKAPVGRWQKGKDLHWYTREKKSEAEGADEMRAELQRVKDEEERQMMEALGLAPKRERRPLHGAQLDKREMEDLFRRGKADGDGCSPSPDVDRVKGLGFAPAAAALQKLQEKPLAKTESEQEAAVGNSEGAGLGQMRVEGGSERGAGGVARSSGSDSESSESTEDRRERKRRRKEEKRERKTRRKQEKRESKKARRDVDSKREHGDRRRDEGRNRDREGGEQKDRERGR